MSISVLSKTSPRPVNGGVDANSGAFEQCFTCAFSTTDETGTVPVGMRKVLRLKDVVLLQLPDVGEQVYFAGTVNGDGSLVLTAAGALSLGRIWSLAATFGLKFSFTVEGYI